MKRKMTLLLTFLFLFVLISACSSNHSDQSSKDNTSVSSNKSSPDMETESEAFAENDVEETSNDSAVEKEESGSIEDESGDIDTNRMIIHTAQLQIQVKDFSKTQIKIEDKVNEYAGYVVESSVYRTDDEHRNGQMIVRIPEEHFEKFLTDTEEVAVKILSRNVSGEDVTEKYVDLKSRLKSKQVVEERLLTFMNEAEKTEDLLNISADLATVQEEIEVIVGKMNYLENQSEYATIELSIQEDQIAIPDIDNKNLNTWEKTKKQLVENVNYLLKFGSGLIVFFIGNLPVIILLLVIGTIVYFMIRIRKRRKIE